PAGSVAMTASLVQLAFDADVRSAHVSAKALAEMDTAPVGSADSVVVVSTPVVTSTCRLVVRVAPVTSPPTQPTPAGAAAMISEIRPPSSCGGASSWQAPTPRAATPPTNTNFLIIRVPLPAEKKRAPPA